MNLKEQLETIREAYDHAMRAQGLYDAYRKEAGAHGTPTPELPFAPLLVALTHVAGGGAGREDRGRARLANASVKW